MEVIPISGKTGLGLTQLLTRVREVHDTTLLIQEEAEEDF